MQMIHSAGGTVLGEYPFFESGLSEVPQQDGLSFKILRPLDITIPSGNYRVVWLDRNSKQQAMSELKFLKHQMNVDVPNLRDNLIVLHDTLRIQALERLHTHGDILQITFEDLISKRETVEQLAQFLGLSDIDKMLKQIIPRSAACLPDLQLETRLVESDSKVLER